MKFELGDLVIVNDKDRPCARLVAEVVVPRNNGCVVYRYLDERVDGHARNAGDGATMHLVTDFGVRISARSSLYLVYFDRIKLSNVHYSSGEVRAWQPEYEEGLKLRNGSSEFRKYHMLRFYMRHFSDAPGRAVEDYVLPFFAKITSGEIADLDEAHEHAEKIKSWAAHDSKV